MNVKFIFSVYLSPFLFVYMYIYIYGGTCYASSLNLRMKIITPDFHHENQHSVKSLYELSWSIRSASLRPNNLVLSKITSIDQKTL